MDNTGRTITFRAPGMELDLGGIGKGYAVDQVITVLRQAAVTSALIDAGSSTLYALGAPPGKSGWKVIVPKPGQRSQAVSSVFLRDASLSTSGSYEKFFRAEGKIYAHIMDPRTGYPAQGSVSVSVLAPRTLDSEAWAKPFFVNGRQWAAKHRPKDVRVFFCEDRMEKPCAWLQ